MLTSSCQAYRYLVNVHLLLTDPNDSFFPSTPWREHLLLYEIYGTGAILSHPPEALKEWSIVATSNLHISVVCVKQPPRRYCIDLVCHIHYANIITSGFTCDTSSTSR